MSLPIPQFRCEPCDISVNSEAQLNQHCSGSRHQSIVNGTYAGGDGPPRPKISKTDKIKAAGINYFVKEGSSDPNQAMPPGAGAVGSVPGNSDVFCSTCRIHLTSQAQAQVHYQGAKHRNKLKLQEEMKASNGDTSQVAVYAGDTDSFCNTCMTKLTSLAQAQSHYAGTKHQQKKKQLQVPDSSLSKAGGEGCNQLVMGPNGFNPDEFCSTCRTQFTSTSQARMHYEGSKHRQKILLLQGARNAPMESGQMQEGEPNAKKRKFTEICETCNVVMTCPEMATAHYEGSKHRKKLALLSSIDTGAGGGQQNHGNNPYQLQCVDHSGPKRAIQKQQTAGPGTRHKMKVEDIAYSGGSGDMHNLHHHNLQHQHQQGMEESSANGMMQQTVQHTVTKHTAYVMGSMPQPPFHNSGPMQQQQQQQPAGGYPFYSDPNQPPLPPYPVQS